MYLKFIAGKAFYFSANSFIASVAVSSQALRAGRRGIGGSYSSLDLLKKYGHSQLVPDKNLYNLFLCWPYAF